MSSHLPESPFSCYHLPALPVLENEMFALMLDYMLVEEFDRPLFEVEEEFRHFFDDKHPFYQNAGKAWKSYLPLVDASRPEMLEALFRFVKATETTPAHWDLLQQVLATSIFRKFQKKTDSYHPLRWLILHHIHPSFIKQVQLLKLPAELIQCCLFASIWAKDTMTTEILLDSVGADVDREHLCVSCQSLAGHELPVARSPLAFAFELGQLPATRALLERGATANAVMADGWTALHSATRSGLCGAVELLFQNPLYGVDVHARDISGRTAYMIAAQMNTATILQCLVDHGASEDLDVRMDVPVELRQEGVVQVGLCLGRMLRGQVQFVPVILDLAEYWAVSSAERRDPEGVVFRDDPSVQPYLTLKITGRHKKPLRRLVFTTVSHDQGMLPSSSSF